MNEEHKLSPILNKDQDASGNSSLLHESEQRLLSNEKLRKSNIDQDFSVLSIDFNCTKGLD